MEIETQPATRTPRSRRREYAAPIACVIGVFLFCVLPCRKGVWGARSPVPMTTVLIDAHFYKWRTTEAELARWRLPISTSCTKERRWSDVTPLRRSQSSHAELCERGVETESSHAPYQCVQSIEMLLWACLCWGRRAR